MAPFRRCFFREDNLKKVNSVLLDIEHISYELLIRTREVFGNSRLVQNIFPS